MEVQSSVSLISVIMPSYNSAHFIEDAVVSVMGQTYSNVELIVVDDGSSDETIARLEILSERYLPRLRFFSQNHQGPYPARNLGLKHAKGEWIAFLDADDYWSSDALEKLHSAIARSSSDIAYCGWQNVGVGAPGIQPHVPPDYLELDTAAEFLRSCPWPIHAALVNRKALDDVGGFSERCFSAMDYDLWLRLFANAKTLVRVPEVLAFYRWHNHGQISKTKWKQVLDALRVRREFMTQFPEAVSHLGRDKRRELVDGFLVNEAYKAYWKRQVEDSRMLFREVFKQRLWGIKDIKYVLLSLLPPAIFSWMLRLADETLRKPQ